MLNVLFSFEQLGFIIKKERRPQLGHLVIIFLNLAKIWASLLPSLTIIFLRLSFAINKHYISTTSQKPLGLLSWKSFKMLEIISLINTNDIWLEFDWNLSETLSSSRTHKPAQTETLKVERNSTWLKSMLSVSWRLETNTGIKVPHFVGLSVHTSISNMKRHTELQEMHLCFFNIFTVGLKISSLHNFYFFLLVFPSVELYHTESLPKWKLIHSANIVKPVQTLHPRANKHDNFNWQMHILLSRAHCS